MSIFEAVKKHIKRFRKKPFEPRHRGLHFDDPFISKLKGYNKREAATHSGMDLYVEIDRISNALFPLIEVPSETQGYVRHESNYFDINHPNSKLRETLVSYFLGRRSPMFNNARDLASFFEMLSSSLLKNGKVFFLINWEKLGGKQYILSEGFRYLRTSTIKILRRNRKIVGFRQKYSLVARAREEYYHLRNDNFTADEVLCLEYPFDKRSPVQRSLKYLKAVDKFWNYGIEQSQANAEPNNYSLEVEKARYGNYAMEKRAYDITRARIRGEFNYIIESVNLTSFYDVYSVIKYKKFLNDFRHYFIEQFNKQVLEVAAKKNGWKVTPKLELKEGLLLDNQKLDEYFKQYSSGEIDFDTIVELAVRPA